MGLIRWLCFDRFYAGSSLHGVLAVARLEVVEELVVWLEKNVRIMLQFHTFFSFENYRVDMFSAWSFLSYI